MSALLNLGYGRAEAIALLRAQQKAVDTGAGDHVSSLIANALREMGQMSGKMTV